MAPLILGSKSPRRKEILSYFALPFEQVESGFPEESLNFEGDPALYACQLSQAKSEALFSRFPTHIILTADTVVYKEGKLYGKPENKEEAIQFLSELSGSWHSVYTALSIRQGEHEFHQAEETRVLFRLLTNQQIALYQEAIDWHDKAGGYAIQESGALIVERVEGCYYNVMGLPIGTLAHLLQKININLWNYLK